MNIKRYAVACFAVFIVLSLIDLLFDFLLLGPINHSLKNVWRPDMIHWLEPVTYLSASILFVLLLTHIHNVKGVSGGVLYGLLVGLLVSGVHSFGQYATYPIPFVLAVLWFVEGLVQYAIAGIVTALICRPKIQHDSKIKT